MKTLFRTRGIAHDLVVSREGNTLTLWSATGIRHSVMDLEAPHVPGLEYARNTLAVLAFRPDATAFLVLGLGGGSIPRMFAAACPGARIDAVEIDPVVPAIARRFFLLDTLAGLEVFLEDGTNYLRHCEKNYDIIIVDAYIGESFPDQMASLEFLVSARRCLTHEGVLVMNWMGGETGLFDTLLSNIENTVGPIWLLSGLQSRNTLIFAPLRRTNRKEVRANALRIQKSIPSGESLCRMTGRLRSRAAGVRRRDVPAERQAACRK